MEKVAQGVNAAVSRDGRLLAAGGHFGRVRVWDMTTRRVVAEMHGGGVRVRALAFSIRLQRAATESEIAAYQNRLRP